MITTSKMRVLAVAVVAAIVIAWSLPAQAQKFYPDDPIWREPPPENTLDPQHVMLSGLLEYFTNQFASPGERQPEVGIIPAGNVNTVGGVPDSPWFTNRHGFRRMTLDELVAGPGSDDPPRTDAPWRVLTVKQYGDRTGMLMVDADNTIYLLRFDPKNYPELQTGAELVASKFYYAAGYNTTQNYLVNFERDRLVVGDGAEKITSQGDLRDLVADDIDRFLKLVAHDPTTGYRAVATRVPYQEVLGNYQFYATRSDDPNDIVPHEHRRDLRGQWVFHAWLANDQFNPANTLEAVVTDGGVQYIERHIIDFFKTLGAGDVGVKTAREGNEYRFNLSTALKNVAGMGFWSPGWTRATYSRLRSVGNFEGRRFDADAWRPDTHFVTWDNRLPDDIYWAAKIVMSFTDEEIRAIVNVGGYSAAEASLWISDALIQRRDKIGEAFLQKVLPLDNFRVENNRLEFDDLVEVYGFGGPRQIDMRWYEFDNTSEVATLITGDRGTDGRELPAVAMSAADNEYFAAELWADDPQMNVRVYVRKNGAGFDIVGIDRNWPGKHLVESEAEVGAAVTFSRYASFDDRQQALLDDPARAYSEVVGRNLTAEEWFNRLSLSERTTYDAVTHALMNSELTDEKGDDLGTAFDLIAAVERIAGQYSGRGGDQQFRLYVDIKPETEDILARSVEFFVDKENTVYHVGYPKSYRQEGNVPNIQFSVSEDGARADIDVDYRSSKSPQALFNGHLTSANSDVRAGDNHDRHDRRWRGLINWWQDVFGNIGPRKSAATDLMARKIDELPTPLPPDRPLGAAPEELSEAAQEFFTDWLVRGKVDEAMEFFSRRVIACINIDDDAAPEILDVDAAVREMREIMSYSLDQLGDRDNLTEVMDEVVPWTQDQIDRIESHPFDGDFTIIQVRNQVAVDFMCSTRRGADPPSMPGGPDGLGTYYAVVFRIKAEADQGGVIAFLWDKQEGAWKVVSYAVVDQ